MKKTRSIFALLLALLMTVICAVPAFSASEDPEAQALANNRHSIGLTGVHNARELGGYATQDGRHVKFGKLIRTAKLSDANEDDINRLANVYHVKKDIDFRTDAECTIHPDKDIPGCTYYHYSALGTGIPQYDLNKKEDQEALAAYAKSIASLDKDGDLVDHYYKDMYKSLYTTEEGLNAYRNFFQQLLDANGETVLWHCTSGKDRAGNAAMLLLMALGVDKETAIQDFLNTNYYYKEDMEKTYNIVYKVTGNEKTAADFASNAGVKREWIETSFDTIEKNYGSVDNFLHKGLGLTDQDLQQLRNAYTE